jgi:hypothetical protein
MPMSKGGLSHQVLHLELPGWDTSFSYHPGECKRNKVPSSKTSEDCSMLKWPCNQVDPCQGNPNNTNYETHPGKVSFYA